MKIQSLISAAVLAASNVSAHTILQKISVNGADQGQLKGVRAPDSDYPIQNVNDASFACNKDIKHKDNTVINIPAGAKIGGWWGHVIGGAQGANDPDHPIAKSHKGPISYWLAKVDSAANTGTTGLQWFKVAHEGLSNGKWAVDNMIANQGWHYFTMPSCIAPGEYLLRVELLALHSAGQSGQAQFYMECAQIKITGSGTSKGSNFVSFPGAYKSNDPGILLSIYDTTGQPYMGGKPYQIPGPAPLVCGADSGSGGQTPEVTPPVPGNGAGGATAPLYGQCGGNTWTGPTACAEGVCKASGEYYSQCVPN
ncbi:carbohydrate-binding module family 1 protein [Aaosphaeria arxii CBS 175.79]|uniref:AA9 family lytic polysaccharide monooxygenase n=1 Tax=Aaosphaeria arxii CBS 175.79 TaxID=1450172 RepID=A0A6A5XB87_9PLEO|nr:carbohydrate-binding module family 1 protein [Aaosphaeria arxii CBS 175.79]KAF2010034.1 carbohydrate-binding module family 1 protein [Aaosphaeria arxii CBS 175.79]